jgi:COP9 signalosome complex subunit 2
MAIKAPNSASSSSNLKTESFDADNCIGTLLLEVFAIEIQMYTDRKEHKKLRVGYPYLMVPHTRDSLFVASFRIQEIYDQTLTVKSTIPHPKIMGIIRECGGKMHMSES